MKLRFLYKALFITSVIFLAISCNDTLDQVGFSIQPPNDRSTVGVDTLQLQARTIQVDSMFVKTKFPVLGEYTDPIFGSIKSEYIGEFYLSSGAEFKEGAVIDSVTTVITYTSIMGDSLAPMELSVYEVNKSLKNAGSYTNIDPSKYTDMSSPLGTQLFTGKNTSFQTVTYTSGNTTESFRIYSITVKLPIEIGNKLLNEYKQPGHGKLSDPDTFREFFPGLYFTTTFGNSTILNVNLTSLFVHYRYLDKGGSSKETDTIRTDAFRLNITPEVTQINYVENDNNILLEDNDQYTYVKSPAGVNTEITFPLSNIQDKLESQALNLANFTVYVTPEATENPMVKLNPPNYLLLINRDSLAGFFEQRKLSDNITSFLSDKFETNTYSYKFNNISTMINYYNHYKKEHGGEPLDLVYYLIPVDVTYTTIQSGSGSSTQTLSSINNQMWPTAATLDKQEGSLKLELIFSKY